MSRYEDDNYSTPNMRQKDLVLSTNEFVFIQNKTNGTIKTYTGPIMVTISAQESMVVFDSKTKRFKETSDFEQARQLFTSAPEGWYVVLKNPAKDSIHPDPAKAMNSPELEIGRKINVSGPCSFSLFPGQMAKVVQGHKLRSNQYLLARVYDADAASKSSAIIVDAEGNEVETENQYFVGQLLVIKGTEVSFYMPPTGIEVIPVDGRTYVREAVTLERLEYAILKDEDGEKRYVHGPAVVFPKPTETFVDSPKGGTIFRALELSPISGIYVKVIADYKEGNKEYKTGEELFITGNDQMIYYPRPEHALIQYDGKYMHHAIAIPEGEGRYILNRLTGDIVTIKGPAMYLPDPRKEVVVKRKLTERECNLFYPGNTEVLTYNGSLSEKATEKMARKGMANTVTDAINSAYSTSNQLDSLAIFEANANISRGVSYTKPRTITLDTKYDGVVSINVWTGYAISVLSKTGHKETIIGPATRLLDYDETLETIVDANGTTTAYLKIDNNKIINTVTVQTSDFVDAQIKVAYNVNFNMDENNSWFNVENYPKVISDTLTSKIKRKIKEFTIQEFYANATEIIREIVLGTDNLMIFTENGMEITDLEILTVSVERTIAEMLEKHQQEMIQKNLELADADAKMKVITALAENEKKEAELKNANEIHKMLLAQGLAEEKLANKEALEAKERAIQKAKGEAELELQKVIDSIEAAKLARTKADADEKLRRKAEEAKIAAEEQAAYAETVKSIMESISPDLVAALSTKANAELLTEATKNMSAYSIANGESIAETVDRLMRGTTLEGLLSQKIEK